LHKDGPARQALCWDSLSVPGGVKPTFLAQHGHEVINPKLPDEDFNEAVRIAQAEFDKHQPDVVVGSSRGGAVAMNISSGDARLVLLCPAWKLWGTARAKSVLWGQKTGPIAEKTKVRSRGWGKTRPSLNI
jgi:alpha-beta hydrolase superfamily lysophospholipase